MTTCPSCGANAADDARFCANCGTPLQPAGSEERKLATIVFADVIGSTDLGEQLDPERLRALLAEYFGQMSRVIETWGGTVEKYIGDAIMAVFGVPIAREDDAVRALNAAREMIGQLEKLNPGFEERHGVRLGVRIGVNTGEVLAPSSASAGGQFLVQGDPVNVAARLEQAAEPATVLVGERTWLAARAAFDFGEPVPLTLKGKREPVIARALGQPISAEQRGVRFQAPMVGRERELETVLGLLDEAIDSGVPRLAVISGPAGIGKSRLLREFVSAAQERQQDVTVFRGRCLAAGHGITFWALGEILRAECRISLDEPGESAAQKLIDTVTALLQPLHMSAAESVETVHALAMTAGLTLPDNPLAGDEPNVVGEAIARAWSRYVTALARRSPVALVVEDLHWADERMVAMLELLAARAAGPALLLATARPEFLESHVGLAGGDLTVVALRPLSDTQSDRLVSELLGDSESLQSLVADIRQKADGNPFFLEEILQRLIDEGAIVHEAGRWRPTQRATEIRLPDTIHGLLAARIDALPSVEKGVLQQAAVVGRIFWPGSLANAGGGSAEPLRTLERRGLVSARPTSSIDGEVEYMFRHVLIRDVAYASVPKSRRATAHAETGAWIERLAGDRLEEFDELLAYHYSSAVAGEDADLAWADLPAERERLRSLAFEALIRAGDLARQRFAVDKALTLHQQALDLAAGEPELARAHESLGDDHDALFHMDEAVERYLAAIDHARLAGESTAAIGLLAAKISLSAQRWGAFKEAPPIDRIKRVVDDALASDIGDATRSQLLTSRGSIVRQSVYASSHEPLAPVDRALLPEAIASAEEGLAIARRLDDPTLLHRAYVVLSLLYWQDGQVERSREMTENDLGIVDRLPTTRQKVDVLDGIAAARINDGRFVEGLEVAERAYAMAVDLSAHERMHTSFTLMWAAEALGKWDRAVEVLEWHASAAAAEPAVTCPNVRGGGPLGATLLVRRGAIDRALELVPVEESALKRNTFTDKALIDRYAALTGNHYFARVLADNILAQEDRLKWPDGLDALIEALAELGRDDQVEILLPALRDQAPGDARLAPLADRFEAELMLRHGRPSTEIRPLLERALAWFDERAMPFEAARTRETLARVANPAEGRALLESAIETYVQLGARPYADAASATLANLGA